MINFSSSPLSLSQPRVLHNFRPPADESYFCIFLTSSSALDCPSDDRRVLDSREAVKMGLLSGYRPLVRRIGSFKLSGNGKRRPQVTKTLSTLSTNQLLVSDAGDDHGESRGGGDSSTGSSRPRNQKAIMDGKKGGGGAGEAPAASGSTKEDRRVHSTRKGEEGSHSASSSSSLLSGDRREEEEIEEEEFGRQWRLGSGDFPGSPSFREYCHISVADTDDSAEDGDYRHTDGESSHERKGSNGSATPTTTDQTKKSPPAAKDRFKRLRLLTRAPIAMLNVRSCYHHCSSSQESPRLLAVKSAS
ncbi:uncharacterized protein LOC116248415 [Nymphaea colorata]|nr:uncharacterized protein LOC116248415 [Nymphaea colorata]